MRVPPREGVETGPQSRQGSRSAHGWCHGPLWWLAGLHGIFAIAGLGCLLLALRGPPRGLATGTASFGLMAAVLIALAALVGGALLATHLLKRRLPGIVIGIHATLAVSGLVILAAYLFVG